METSWLILDYETYKHPLTLRHKMKLILQGRLYHPSIVSVGRRKAKKLIQVLRKLPMGEKDLFNLYL